MRTAGGEVWVGDETALREFPPLRAAWSKRGQQATVVISGRNARRTVFGALQVTSGELVRLVRERARTADAVALVEALGAVRPTVPKLLVWDNAPPHHPTAVNQAAQEAGVELVFLPFRSPELMPLEELWRGLKAAIAANRAYPTMEELADCPVAWLDAMANDDRLRRCGVRSSKFNWLPT
jgi:transposase